MSYFPHWPLSLFYSKSLGNFCVNLKPPRKRSGKFLRNKNPYVRDLGFFYVISSPLRKRSGILLCK